MKKTIFIVFTLMIITAGYWLISPSFTTKTVNDALPAASENNTMLDGAADIPSPSPITPTSTIVGTPGHPASGEVKIIKMANQPDIVRFENYAGTNGPDLFVYLAKDLEAKEFINLGRAKGNVGDINYEVPAGVNVSEYKYLMTWCKLFGVLFDYAEIN